MSSFICGLLGQAGQTFDPLGHPLRGLGSSGRDLAMLLGAVAVPVLLFVLWAVFVRKRKKSLSGWRTHQHGSQPHSNQATSEAGQGERRRRRRRRREHRPRNPTLAETGGLPPVRDDHESETVP